MRNVLVLVGAMAAASAYAGGTQGSNKDTIEVIGRKPEEARQEAKEFLAVTGVAERPVARWVDPICPVALNVRRDVAERVTARVRDAAIAAGAKVAKRNCAPNLKIVFSHDAKGLLKQVSSRTGMFSDLPARERALLHADTTPVRWWHTIEERTKDGMRPMASDTPPAAGINAGSGQVVLGGLVHQQYRSSLLSSQMVRGIIAAKVIIDVKLAEGMPVDSVADYAALVGLAEVRLDENAPPNSILALFDANGPKELTTLDQSFLRTLYKLPLDRTVVAHRGLLVKGMTSGGELKQAER